VRGGSYGNRAVGSSGAGLICAILAALASFDDRPWLRLGLGAATRPATSLASSPAAQRSFALQRALAVGRSAGRAKLEPALASSRPARLRPRARLARLYLASDRHCSRRLAERERWSKTRARERPAARTTSPMWRAQRSWFVRASRTRPWTLEPLEGKIIDADERLLWASECTPRWRAPCNLAVDHAALAGRGAAEDRGSARREHHQAAHGRSAGCARAERRRWTRKRAAAARQSVGARNWLRKTLREKLVKVARSAGATPSSLDACSTTVRRRSGEANRA
jgi:hypothetical protein